MKRLLLTSIVSLMLIGVSAQRYDYDDIYFNPKTDLRQERKAEKAEAKARAEAERAELDGASAVLITQGEMSYTDRINAFHRTEGAETDALAHIGDPDYTTNVFVLTDGQYVVNVDGDDVYINENYNYPWSDWNYWNRGSWWYGPSYSAPYWGYSYGWYGYSNPWYDPWYDPYWGFGWGYDPYWGYNPYWGCHHHYHGWYDPGFYYPGYYDPYYPSYGGLYASGSSENSRRSLNSASRYASGVTNSTSNRGSSASRNSVNSQRRNSNSTARGSSTNSVSRGSSSTQRGTSVNRGSSVSRNSLRSNYLPARPTSQPRQNTLRTSTSYEYVNRGTSGSSSNSTSRSTVRRSSNTSTRSTYTTPRSSGGSRSGFGSGGSRSGGGNSTPRRR